MIKCHDVQEAIWCADLTPEMIEHILSCKYCQQEQKLVQGIGITLDLEDIPMPSRSLLPPRHEVENAVNAHRWRRFSKWATAGVAAACVLFAALQVPGFLNSGMSTTGEGAMSQADQARPQESAASESKKSDAESMTSLDTAEKKTERLPVAPESDFVRFLSSYGWTPNGDLARKQDVKLPDRFTDQPGEYPLGLYWAKQNVLSKDIGYDLTRYRGQIVTAYIIPLKEMWDDGLKMNTEAVVLEKDSEIIGAWLQKGTGLSASLQKRDFAELIGTSWGEWLKEEGHVNYETGPDAEMKDWTPEQVILKYYEAIQNHDFPTAYALYSKAYQSTFWYTAPSDNLFAQDWYKEGFDPQNISFVKVIDIQSADDQKKNDQREMIKGQRLNRNPADRRQFQVTLDVKYKKQTVQPDGINAWYVDMVKESKDAPWKIDLINASPR
jgi:hypothetical protein